MSGALPILSLGWGVQSFTLAAMVALGDLPPLYAALHADTTHERSDTYTFAAQWTPWLEAHHVHVVTVRDERAATRVWMGEMIPAYTHAGGQAKRTCSQRWKIAPQRRWMQAHRDGQSVELWMGISLDEVTRMKPSPVQYITHRWPLVEKRMRRDDCENWLRAHGLPIPPRSACVFCPLHGNAFWRQVRECDADWHKALEVDRLLRHARPPEQLFLSSQRVPLDTLDLRTPQERGQLDLFEQEECEGACFL